MSLYAVKSADGFAGIAVKSTESLATELMVASSEKKNSITTRKEHEMASENETVADIVAQLRAAAHIQNADSPRDVLKFADRIEAAAKRFYDKYKEHTDELNRQILVLKREKEMSDTYFCGYDPEEALVAQCSTCRFFKKKHSHCTLNDSLTNAKYKCSGWKFKTNKECSDEYKSELNREVEKLRAENARLRAALKPVLECKVMSAMTAEIEPGKSDYCAALIEKAQRIYNEGEEKQKEGGAK